MHHIDEVWNLHTDNLSKCTSSHGSTCLDGLKEAHVLPDKRSKQLHLDSASEAIDGTHEQASTTTCTGRTDEKQKLVH